MRIPPFARSLGRPFEHRPGGTWPCPPMRLQWRDAVQNDAACWHERLRSRDDGRALAQDRVDRDDGLRPQAGRAHAACGTTRCCSRTVSSTPRTTSPSAGVSPWKACWRPSARSSCRRYTCTSSQPCSRPGDPLLAAQLIQIGLGAAAVGMLFATARHWFGERAALVAAALAILTGVFTFNEVLILQSALDPFLVSCSLYALTRTMAGGGTWAFAAAGGSLGLLALNRPNALAVRSGRGCRCVRHPVAAHGSGSDSSRPAPVVGSGQSRHGAHSVPAQRPRRQRGAQLRRVRGPRLDCVARWAESLHRQPRSRRRDLHPRAGRHSIDRRSGRGFDPRGGVGCGPTTLSRGGLRLFRAPGHRLGHRTSRPTRSG